ncbi:MAG: 4-hydroxybenzoate octaprenyltransferase [Euryarchaeota archaeon]|nr:4-hydroxybenzoate octaprenyltransferase [Euryarchaeota archaeon]
MDLKQIASFVKLEHTLFSLPFVFIGAFLAHDSGYEVSLQDLFWILIAAVGARGLAMTLNRIIDRKVDSENPRTAQRHLASGSMSMSTAVSLGIVFTIMLILGAWMLNEIALYMSWLPVLTFVVYPYLKRFTWLCHFWLGLCLGLAPAGAWVGIVGDDLGWEAIFDSYWFPEVFACSVAVLLWITSFDLGYARMDVESDKENGIISFPARFGEKITRITSLVLTLSWLVLLSNLSALVASLPIFYLVLKWDIDWKKWQGYWFIAHVSTGWILLTGYLILPW